MVPRVALSLVAVCVCVLLPFNRALAQSDGTEVREAAVGDRAAGDTQIAAAGLKRDHDGGNGGNSGSGDNAQPVPPEVTPGMLVPRSAWQPPGSDPQQPGGQDWQPAPGNSAR